MLLSFVTRQMYMVCLTFYKSDFWNTITNWSLFFSQQKYKLKTAHKNMSAVFSTAFKQSTKYTSKQRKKEQSAKLAIATICTLSMSRSKNIFYIFFCICFALLYILFITHIHPWQTTKNTHKKKTAALKPSSLKKT